MTGVLAVLGETTPDYCAGDPMFALIVPVETAVSTWNLLAISESSVIPANAGIHSDLDFRSAWQVTKTNCKLDPGVRRDGVFSVVCPVRGS